VPTRKDIMEEIAKSDFSDPLASIKLVELSETELKEMNMSEPAKLSYILKQYKLKQNRAQYNENFGSRI
jgi:hypothetical protein